jgi:hypothetical protein
MRVSPEAFYVTLESFFYSRQHSVQVERLRQSAAALLDCD